ncbi:hypothetical protein YC2023_041740 [Brassica napus]
MGRNIGIVNAIWSRPGTIIFYIPMNSSSGVSEKFLDHSRNYNWSFEGYLISSSISLNPLATAAGQPVSVAPETKINR